MSDRKLGVVLLWIIPLIFTVIGPYSVNDLADWIRLGQYFLSHHEILRNDLFSVLPTSPLVYPAWGISVVYAWIYSWSDLTAVCLLHSLFLSLLLWIIYKNSVLLLPNPMGKMARYSTYVFWLGAAACLGERPAMVALIPMTLAFLEISKIKRNSDIGARQITTLVLLNILWVNIHGSFILLGLMLLWKTVFLFRSRELPRTLIRPMIAIISVGISSLVNPFSWRIFPYVFETIRKSQNRMFQEWEPTRLFAHFPVGVLYFALLSFILVLIFRRSRKPRFLTFLSSPFFLLMLSGMFAIRNAALPFLVLLPTLKQWNWFDSHENPPVNKPKPSNLLLLGLFIAAFIAILPAFKPAVSRFLPPDRREVFDSTAPFELAHAIAMTGKTCPIFNSSEVGSFLMLELPNKIFIDARNIIYSDQTLRDYFSVMKALPGWAEYLEKYQACFALLNGETSVPLVHELQNRKDWRELGREKGLILFEKT